jgi:hypothetical protein
MDLLRESGIVTGPPRVAGGAAGRLDQPLTPEAAARLLGIRDPNRVEVFAAMAKTLVDQENADVDVGAGKR